MLDLDDPEEEWEVEEVKDQQLVKGEKFYLVKWTGWPSEYNQWVPEEDMANAQQAIQKYLRNTAKKEPLEGRKAGTKRRPRAK